MKSVYELLEYIKSVIAGADLRNVFSEFEKIPVSAREQRIYLTVGIKEILTDKPVDGDMLSEKIYYPLRAFVTLNVLARPDVEYREIYSFFEAVVLQRLLPRLDVSKIKTKPMEFNKTLNKLQLYSEAELTLCAQC